MVSRRKGKKKGTRTLRLIGTDALAGPEVLAFDGPNCTGTPFIFSPSDLFEFDTYSRNAAVGPDGVLYGADPNEDPGEEQIASAFDFECFNFGPFPFTVAPTVPVIDLTTLFTPPFSIEFKDDDDDDDDD